MTKTTSPIHDLAVETDTVLADLYAQSSKIKHWIWVSQNYISTIENLNAKAIAAGKPPVTVYKFTSVEDEQQKIDLLTDDLAAVEAKAAPFEAIFSEHRWSRFFLVRNTNGHIHSSLNCQTCFWDTDFAWLPSLSGLTESDAVAEQGEILCSVCFPSAPVEWTNGSSNATKDAKAERAAAKAERLAKKVAKALVPDDIEGGLVIDTGKPYPERIKTIAAAKAWLTDAAEYNSYYPRTYADGEVQTNDDGTVTMWHPSYPPAYIDLVAEVLAARIDSTPEAEIAAAQKRAAKRR